jgi:hypothetical protein
MGIPEIDLNIDSQEIVAKSRKLKAVWSREAAEDLRSFHNLDAEKALILAKEINAEIDREILQDLKSAAEKGCDVEKKLNKKKKVKVTYRSIDSDWEPTKKD